VRFVDVDRNVGLEVLDWGGSGSPLVLLAGGGDTAHVFDDFAPQTHEQLSYVGKLPGAASALPVLSVDYVKSQFAAAEWYAAFRDDPTGSERQLVFLFACASAIPLVCWARWRDSAHKNKKRPNSHAISVPAPSAPSITRTFPSGFLPVAVLKTLRPHHFPILEALPRRSVPDTALTLVGTYFRGPRFPGSIRLLDRRAVVNSCVRCPLRNPSTTIGRITLSGGASKFATRKNAIAGTLSECAALWSFVIYQLTNLTPALRGPAVSGMRRSFATEMVHGMSTTFAALRKKRRAKSREPSLARPRVPWPPTQPLTCLARKSG